jgi:hypothetical protein
MNGKRLMMKKTALLLILFVVGLTLTGCVLTKVVTVPMRVTGAVISVIPVVGNTIDGSIDTAADVADKLPI